MDKLKDLLKEGYAIEFQEGITKPYFLVVKPCGGQTKIKEEVEIGGASLDEVIEKAYSLITK